MILDKPLSQNANNQIKKTPPSQKNTPNRLKSITSENFTSTTQCITPNKKVHKSNLQPAQPVSK